MFLWSDITFEYKNILFDVLTCQLSAIMNNWVRPILFIVWFLISNIGYFVIIQVVYKTAFTIKNMIYLKSNSAYLWHRICYHNPVHNIRTEINDGCLYNLDKHMCPLLLEWELLSAMTNLYLSYLEILR